MTNDGKSEATNRSSNSAARAARGQENVVTQPGEHVANLTPPRVLTELDKVRRLATRIRTSRDEHPLGKGAPIRDMIEEVRR